MKKQVEKHPQIQRQTPTAKNVKSLKVCSQRPNRNHVLEYANLDRENWTSNFVYENFSFTQNTERFSSIVQKETEQGHSEN